MGHRDLDQIHTDLRSPKHLARQKALKPAEDLPGLGRWYCIECAKWFEGEHSLVQHRRGKNHKRRCCSYIDSNPIVYSILTADRVRLLRETPYTQKEADAAAGLRTDNGTRQTSNATDEGHINSAMDTVLA